VVCRCIYAMSDYMRNLYFKRIIIDDANQVSETLALVPLVKSC
jgi:hypothetical protein